MDPLDLPPPPGMLVLLFAAPTASEGLLARGLLESQGIPVLVKGETQGPYRLGPMYLWVPEGFEVQARTILAEARAAGRQAGRNHDRDDATT